MNILALMAHAEDAAFFCSGTLAKYKAAGHNIYIAVATGSEEPWGAKELGAETRLLGFEKNAIRDDMITRDDFDTIFTRYINSTTDEDLMEFDAYRLSMPLDRNYIDYKLNQIILDLYNDKHVEGFEARMLKDAMETEAFKEKFGSQYDLSFLPAKLREELGE